MLETVTAPVSLQAMSLQVSLQLGPGEVALKGQLGQFAVQLLS